MVPNGQNTHKDDRDCAWSQGYFPMKQLRKNGGGVGTYWGAIPQSMISNAAARAVVGAPRGMGDIFVSNILDRIHFNIVEAGDCSNPTGIAYITNAADLAPPGDLEPCAAEGELCNFSGTKEVWYGQESGWSAPRADGTIEKSWRIALVHDGIKCTKAAFGGKEPRSGAVKAYKVRESQNPAASNWLPPVLNPSGGYYARVQVCDGASGVLQDKRNYDFCKPCPNGKYKPTDVIQKYSDKVHLAAFGYLMNYAVDATHSADDSPYGGVLRSPMKYVGGKDLRHLRQGKYSLWRQSAYRVGPPHRPVEGQP